MKKIVAIWMILVLLMACVGALASESLESDMDESTMEDAFYEGDEDLGDEDLGDEADMEDPQPALPQDASQTPSAGDDADAPEVRWLYPVPLTALYSQFNTLVNRDNLLTADDEPGDLIKATVKRATSATVLLRQPALQALTEMFDAAKEAGYTLFLKSGYRSYGTQKTMYNNRLDSNGGKDDGVVSYPGASEHQTGLACDILNADYAGRTRMTTDFAETVEAQWMKENCASFGFILRYPDDKTDITGIIFEPWHFRYVGKEVAKYIMGTGMSLEEFFDEWQTRVAEFQGNGGNVDAQIAYEATHQFTSMESEVLDLYGEDGDAEVSLTF